MNSLLSRNAILLSKVEFIRHTTTPTDTQTQTLFSGHHTEQSGVAAAWCFLQEVASSFKLLAPSARARPELGRSKSLQCCWNRARCELRGWKTSGPELSRGQWWQRPCGSGSPGVVQPLPLHPGSWSQPCEDTASTVERPKSGRKSWVWGSQRTGF